MLKIRLARGGAKKRPYYSIVVADSHSPRDGRFIEKVGSYNPLLKKDDPNRVVLKVERIQEWIGKGAQPTDRVARELSKVDIVKWQAGNNPNKGQPGPRPRNAPGRRPSAKPTAPPPWKKPRTPRRRRPSPSPSRSWKKPPPPKPLRRKRPSPRKLLPQRPPLRKLRLPKPLRKCLPLKPRPRRKPPLSPRPRKPPSSPPPKPATKRPKAELTHRGPHHE